MKIKYLTLFLLSGLCWQTIACAQTANNSQANENQSNKSLTEQKTADQSKEIVLPSGVKEREYEMNPDQSILLLTVNSDGQVFYQDKILDDSALKTVLAEYNEKHKNDPSTSDSKYPSIYDDKYKSFYLKADARAPYSQILKVLTAVQESSQTSYIAKFMVKPQEEVVKMPENPSELEKKWIQVYQTPNGRYIVKYDLGIKNRIDENATPRPNPLTLITKLDATGKVTLNIDPPVAVSELKTRLTKIFKEREQNGVFREGTNEIEKKIFITTEPNVKYGDVIKFIEDLNETGANPVKLVLERSMSGGQGSGSGLKP